MPCRRAGMVSMIASLRMPGMARMMERAAALALACCLACVSGCFSVAPQSQAAEPAASAPRVSGARGPLTREQSAAILEKLRIQSGADQSLVRHAALEEAVSGSPLVAGNKVSLLQDGPATFKSMLEAIERARDHINLETYIFDDGEIGQKFADALMRKQARGVQVNIIYDSA